MVRAGDVVEVAQHREGIYGVRIGKVERIAVGGAAAWVQAPGFEEPWLVPLEYLSVLRTALLPSPGEP